MKKLAKSPSTYYILLIAILTLIPPLYFAPSSAWSELMKDDGGFKGLMVLMGGYVLLYGVFLYGFYRYQEYRLIKDTPTATVQSAPMGRTELKGEAQPDDEAIASPLEERDCVYYSLEVERYEKRGDDREWVTILSRSGQTDFRLNGETGDATIKLDDNPVMRVEQTRCKKYSSLDEMPEQRQERLRELSDDYDEDDEDGWFGGFFDNDNYHHRVTTEHIEVGESIYVLGAGEPADGDAEIAIGQDDATGTFIVSDRSEDDLQSSGFYAAWGSMIGGVLGIPLAYLFILTVLEVL